MVARNNNFSKLQAGYLFPEITRRKNELLKKQPEAKVISLGIGNTTEPLTSIITKSLSEASSALGTVEGYSGYGDDHGLTVLRERLAEKYYNGLVKGDEVFVSDGAKCDIGRLQAMFGSSMSFAVQDPSYPVYVDGGVITGQTGDYDETIGGFKNVTYLPCLPENDFFPDISVIKEGQVIYFCSPNNPTGAVATKDQLKQLVRFAKQNKSIIVFDAAYAMFIRDPELPKSIFEIEGSKEVAIEVNSFSKPAGFTGVRLGWSVVPKELLFDDGTPVRNDWDRICSTIFNEASNIAQRGGLAALSEEGLTEMKQVVDFYMENASIIKACLDDLGLETFGGDNAPYIWTRLKGKNSWDAFSELLEKAHIVSTPGSGFGPAGEGFLRFSAFGHRKDIEEAVERLKKVY